MSADATLREQFKQINIDLMNELALIFGKLGIDTLEVLAINIAREAVRL